MVTVIEKADHNSVSFSANTKEKGASAIGILFVLLVLSVFFTVGVKLVPIFQDNMVIQSQMLAVFEDPQTSKLSNDEILTKFQKHLSVNYIRGFDNRNVKITRDSGIISADISYEVRTNIFKNVDAVVVFSEQYQAKASD